MNSFLQFVIPTVLITLVLICLYWIYQSINEIKHRSVIRKSKEKTDNEITLTDNEIRVLREREEVRNPKSIGHKPLVADWPLNDSLAYESETLDWRKSELGQITLEMDKAFDLAKQSQPLQEDENERTIEVDEDD